jgi:hypothetical protein
MQNRLLYCFVPISLKNKDELTDINKTYILCFLQIIYTNWWITKLRKFDLRCISLTLICNFIKNQDMNRGAQ